MNERATFDPVQFERLSTGSVPGYTALQDMVAVAAAAVSPPSAKVLDLGCGTGAGIVSIARAMPGVRLVGCDPMEPMIATARARCEEAGVKAQLVTGALPSVLSEAPFDVVVCTLVLHFVPPDDRAALLRGIRAALRPGGALVITALERPDTPDAERVWSLIRKHYAATKGVTPAELAARAAQTQGKVHPLASGELADGLRAAGFTAVTPLVRLLAVHTALAAA